MATVASSMSDNLPDEFSDHQGQLCNQSRRESEYTTISSMPPTLPDDDMPCAHERCRPAFRSPSSIRAIQLSSSTTFSPRRQRQDGLRKWSRIKRRQWSTDIESDGAQSGFTHDVMRRRNALQQQDHRLETNFSKSETTTECLMEPSQAPLVLLHVSILPCPVPKYSDSMLKAHAPKFVVDNFFLLQEKLSDVVFTRGVLIPHPMEEYDLLEERLLEALELCTPRLLGCGHFYNSSMDSVSEDDQSDMTFANEDDSTGFMDDHGQKTVCNVPSQRVQSSVSSRHSQASIECDTCAQRIHWPRRGIGRGNRRWDVNFYAANGLMRASSWSAAWQEMERVDVEIMPWIPDKAKRALDNAVKEEIDNIARENHQQRKELEILQDELLTATQKIHDLEFKSTRAQNGQLPSNTRAIQAAPMTVSSTTDSTVPADKLAVSTNHATDIALSRLMINYIIVLTQEWRSLVIAVLFLSLLLLANYLARQPVVFQDKLASLRDHPTATLLQTTDHIGSLFHQGVSLAPSVTTGHSVALPLTMTTNAAVTVSMVHNGLA